MNDEDRLNRLEERVLELEKFVYSEEENISTLDERIKDFAKEIKVPVEKLKRLFDFEKERPYLLKDIEAQTKKERQQKFSTILLTIMRYCYNQKSMDSSNLREIADDRGLLDSNFGHYVSNYNPYIRYMDDKGKDGEYKVTRPKGSQKGKEFIKQLLED